MYSMHGLNTTSCGNAGKWKHNMISYDIDFGSISRHGVPFHHYRKRSTLNPPPDNIL